MNTDPRIPFFNTLACSWDSQQDLQTLEEALNGFLKACAVQPNEILLDVGCGTGNLTCVLLKHLGPAGRVTALDIAPGMLSAARRKTSDPRVTWLQASADCVPVSDCSHDRLICFSAWPHFDDPEAVARESHRILRPGGMLHLLHLISREAVNQIHTTAHPAVQHDLLAPVHEVAALFQRTGFDVLEAFENAQQYQFTARKGAANS